MNIKSTFAAAMLLLSLSTFAQQTITLTVPTNNSGPEIQHTMWGIFFEDINFAGDGGVYAELVKNRSFEFAVPLMGWAEENHERFSMNRASGNATVINRGALVKNNPRFAQLTVYEPGKYSLVNEGFSGMGIRKNVTYNFTMMARVAEGAMPIKLELIDGQKQVVATATVLVTGKTWQQYQATLTATETVEKANLRLVFAGQGTVDLDLVSLFPSDTWKSRPGGLRNDLVQLLYDLKPGFLRFPGGCIVEGRDLSQRYQWKKTVGPVAERELLINRWNTEFPHRPAPDYFQTFGLGFYEYFQMAEDIGAAPLPILSCSIACQFNTGELVPLDQLDPYIQDALDLIEFANGSATTPWGKLRADMGHPNSFNLTMIGVGNEQWGTQYIERHDAFVKAIKAKHPEIKIISSAGPGSEGEFFDYAWRELRTKQAEIVDEHYYQKPDWFLNNTKRYDEYDRQGPKVFAGEYAAQSVAVVSPENKNNWACALAEAAFMTGLERNADVVQLASYAPLFAHTDRWQWTPNLIWFNNLTSFGTPSYYVQKLFANFKGTNVVPISNSSQDNQPNKFFTSAVWDKQTKELIIKVVNASSEEQLLTCNLKGGKAKSNQITRIELKGNPDDTNSIQKPMNVYPKEDKLTWNGKVLNVSIQSYSVSVFRIKVM